MANGEDFPCSRIMGGMREGLASLTYSALCWTLFGFSLGLFIFSLIVSLAAKILD